MKSSRSLVLAASSVSQRRKLSTTHSRCLDGLCLLVLSLQPMLGWLKPLMRTRAWELRAVSICLYRVSSTCFSQWGGLWQTPTITSPLLVLSYVLIRVNPNPYVLSSLLHPSADWAPHIPIDLSHIGQLLLLPLSFIKDKHSSTATLQSGDPSHRVSLVLTRSWSCRWIPDSLSLLPMLPPQALWRGASACWVPEEDLGDYVVPRAMIVFDVTQLKLKTIE